LMILTTEGLGHPQNSKCGGQKYRYTILPTYIYRVIEYRTYTHTKLRLEPVFILTRIFAYILNMI
jgi:hypothetical protein